MNTLQLKKKEERRIRAGHLWIFSNEVDVKKTPLTEYEQGEVVTILDYKGKPLGTGYINPKSLICCRVLSRNAGVEVDTAFIQTRIQHALELREKIFSTPHYRLVYGESDFLPGLVVDRFGDYLSIQCNTAGIDKMLPTIIEVLEKLLAPKGILLRNDSSIRTLEGLEREVSVASGTVPEHIEIEEGGLKFIAPFGSGQKTGFFYDMRDIRIRAGNEAAAKEGYVFDGFCYVGALGIRAAVKGAEHVVFMDASATALEYVEENAKINGVSDSIEIMKGDAFDILRSGPPRAFDFVSVDPPAFIKRKKDAKKGAQAYLSINSLAANLVKNGGYQLGASCSQHFEAIDLKRAIASGIHKSDAMSQVVWQGHQSADHPIHPAMLETEYLKSFCFRVTREL
ncbi:MAG: class I SAM-dependent rRNA methyltransferase [Desulfovibrio sp.]